MSKQNAYYLTEIRPEDFPGGGGSNGAVLSPLRFKVSSPCTDQDRDTAHIWTSIQSLRSKQDRNVAVKGLEHFVKVAQSGPPFTRSFDEKTLHEAHVYTSHVSGQLEKIWRYRRGDIRILFYYAEDRVVLLCDALAKRKDKLSEAEQKVAEKAVDAYLEALKSQHLTWLNT